MQTLTDILSHLSFMQAAKLLGENGKSLILQGGKYEIDPVDQVRLNQQRFVLTLPDASYLDTMARSLARMVGVANVG